jgi:hypothetical protein
VAGIPAELLVDVQSFAVVNTAPVQAMITALRTAAGARRV